MNKAYIKTHNKTGLKYFGKTKRDVEKYYGSGKYWVRHLKKHGYDVDTQIVYQSEELDKFQVFCLSFSYFNDIIKSKDWANLMDENGLDGIVFNDEIRKKMSKARIGKVGWCKGKFNKDHPLFGRKNSKTSIEKMSKIKQGKNNPMYGKRGKNCPFFGIPRSEETKRKISEAQTGKKRGPQKLFTCVNCGKTGGIGPMKQWGHGENCKRRK